MAYLTRRTNPNRVVLLGGEQLLPARMPPGRRSVLDTAAAGYVWDGTTRDFSRLEGKLPCAADVARLEATGLRPGFPRCSPTL